LGDTDLAIATRRNSLQNLLQAKPQTGPKLTGLTYPRVLVASAYSNGSNLKAVLYGKGLETLTVTNLHPSQTYDLVGHHQSITADAQGQAQFDLRLSGRTNLHIERTA
jgi:hypothetical protein